MLSGLLGAGHLASMEQLPGLVAEHAAVAGLQDVRVYVADLRQQMLRELTGRGVNAGQDGDELSIETTLPGRAFRLTRTMAEPGSVAGLQRHWVPVLDGTQRLGVLRVDVPDAEALEAARHLASLVGLHLVSKRSFSDSHARLVRSEPMNIVAEMQWALMPPRTFANGQIVVCAEMEPAYRVGGDAFDYALAGDVLHLAVFDAMGHDTAAGLTANLAMAACRNQRRHDAGLVAMSEGIDQVLIEQFAHTRYATGVLADLSLSTGRLTWVNRGHPPPVLIRGNRSVTMCVCSPSHPMGTGLGLPVNLCHAHLQPGDRLLLYTDGVTEARDAKGQEFGLDRFTEFIIRQQAEDLPVPETLRRLMHAVLNHHRGRLQDDATVLICEWHGPYPVPGAESRVIGGASHNPRGPEIS
ncbi:MULTISPECIES: PP2C family protein-serine/threonine phosphatase [unclassified Streptomyces]|uniref:PP2C family protein-serine/threonine phosphatase n=1 Tax=unclassified Streptomyces TaxID=2593676 RepID=UPI00381D4134